MPAHSNKQSANTFLASVPAPHRKIVAALRSLIHELAPEAKETVLWDSLSYHRPHLGGRIKGAVCLITPKPESVHLGFIHGVALADPSHLLQGTRKSKRFVPIRTLPEVDRNALGNLIRGALKHIPGTA
ncbi:MAG: DUF1801 domain-containing protein [Terriglobia bacterium]